jgi:PleD family two-component response regulator
MVLIVEDSAQTAANLEIALYGVDGLDVRVVATGLEALGLLEAAASTASVTAVVTDLEMPYVDGYELISRMRAMPAHARTPIIVASGSSEPDWCDRALSLGADACFAKPYSPIALRKKLVSLLQEKR